MNLWIPRLILLVLLFWFQLGVMAFLPVPYDHAPVLFWLALYMYLSLKNGWGNDILLSQAALESAIGSSGWVALP